MGHDWLDVAGWVVTGAVTFIAVLLGARLSRHQALEDKVNSYGERISRLEEFKEWISRTFRRE